MQTSGDRRREIAPLHPAVIASAAKQSIVTSCAERWIASLRSQWRMRPQRAASTSVSTECMLGGIISL